MRYGDQIWSSESPVETANNTITHAAIGSASLVALGAAGLYTGTRLSSSGYNAMDYISGTARFLGNLSPFELLNTFRVPEFLSPFTSENFRRPPSTVGYNYWTSKHLASDSTYEWLKYTVGKSDKQLKAAGVTRGMVQLDAPLATALEFVRTSASGRGSLYSIVETEKETTRYLLSDAVHLMSAGKETIPFIGEREGRINQAFRAVLGAGDMWDKNPGFAEESVGTFLYKDKEEWINLKSSYLFAPSITGPLRNLGDLNRRTNYLRSFSAFNMLRFNNLLKDLSYNIGGDLGKNFFSKVIGWAPDVGPATASKMFARFGFKAAGVGAAVLGLQQVDWLRRQSPGMLGEALASGGLSLGLMYGLGRLGVSGRSGAIVGASSFLAQMVLPGFEEGVVPGIATTAANLNVLRASPINPFNYQRRVMEGFLPGISSMETGIGTAVLGMLAIHAPLPIVGKRVNTLLASKNIGYGKVSYGDIAKHNDSIRDIFYQFLSSEVGADPMDSYSLRQRFRIRGQFFKHGKYIERISRINSIWQMATEEFEERGRNNPINTALMDNLNQIAAKHSGKDLWSSFQRNTAGFAENFKASFFGADLSSNKVLAKEAGELFSRLSFVGRLGRTTTVGLGAFVLHGMLTGRFLGSMESASELEDIYSGKQLVEVKKSRWWEGGGTPFEGSETSYYRPHQLHLMLNRVKERALWGEDEDSISPIGKFLRANFTYQLEREHYWDRPYPITQGAFANIPVIGGILSATVGQIFKPTRLMHTNEWMRENPETGEIEYADIYRGRFIEPAYGLGASGTGVPDSPTSASSLYSNMVSQYRELSGLTGFASNVFQEAIFGSEYWHTGRARLAQASQMTSLSRRFWDVEMGGGLLMNEFLRRFLPAENSEIEKYNPLRNTMPGWMPAKFRYGDPYTLISSGEARLPGAGFEALHPELRGLSPEEYPLVYRYQILADVAPLSSDFFRTKNILYQQRYKGKLSLEEEQMIDRIDKYHERIANKMNFDFAHPNAVEVPFLSSISQKAYRTTTHAFLDMIAPIEYLTPLGFRPGSKLLGQNRSPIERYEAEQLYGTPLAFWNEPLRDWIRPAFYSALPWEGTPHHVERARGVDRFFDNLEFVKYMNLLQQAEATGDRSALFEYKWLASRTGIGVNPQGNALSIYWSLPDKERPYFNAFANANISERRDIRGMLPAESVRLYESIWSRVDQGDMSLYGHSSDINTAYMNEQYTSALNYINEYGKMPDADWIGWNPNVNLEDIKVRYVEHLGGDIHDYELWDSDVKRSKQQEFLEDSEEPLFRYGMNPLSMYRRNLYNNNGNMASVYRYGTSPTVQLQMSDNRQDIISNLIAEMF